MHSKLDEFIGSLSPFQTKTLEVAIGELINQTLSEVIDADAGNQTERLKGQAFAYRHISKTIQYIRESKDKE